MRAQRRALTDADVFDRSLAAQRHILASGEWAAAPSVGLYAPVRHETDTALLADAAWTAGKEAFFPCTLSDAPGTMRFAPCPRGRALVKGRFGIPEPAPCSESREACLAGWEDRIPALIIVPGLAFDREGRRLGNGGGYYDRFFAGTTARDALRIGFAYAFQLVGALPAEAWDAPMHAIATEEGLIWL